jgi:hypothetical protein
MPSQAEAQEASLCRVTGINRGGMRINRLKLWRSQIEHCE